MKNLFLSPSPHINTEIDTRSLMKDVSIALIPSLGVALAFFGLPALLVITQTVAFCLLTEYLLQRYWLKTGPTLQDGSAFVTGLLLAFNLPSNAPWWLVLIGSFVAMGIGKISFGGLGQNPFNPALVGRAFLLISFPVQMTSWPLPRFNHWSLADTFTGATTLSIYKETLKMGSSWGDKLPSTAEMFFGQVGGSLGEVSTFALLLGGGYLLYRRVITWHIPVSFLLAVVSMAGILWAVDPSKYLPPLTHLLSGGVMLGAFFMATDYVTSPMTSLGKVIFGAGCGLLTMIIRQWGAYPEGVSFAILLMNACVPLLNEFLHPHRFGHGSQG